MPTDVIEPGDATAPHTYYGHDATGKVTRIVSAPPGLTSANCPTTGTLAKGCRALEITYGLGGAGVPTGRVASVSATLWNPATSTVTSTVEQTYTYDPAGRLATATDARTGLTTSYTWDGTSHPDRLDHPTPAWPPTGSATPPPGPGPSSHQVTRDPASAGGATATLASYISTGSTRPPPPPACPT